MNHDKCAVWATMEVLPGKESEARDFLKEAARRLNGEPGTTQFYAMQINDRQLAIFNVFTDTQALKSHVEGDVAKWVQASRADLFVGPYSITNTEIFATKTSVADAAAAD